MSYPTTFYKSTVTPNQNRNYDDYYWLNKKYCPHCQIRMAKIDGNCITGKVYQCPKCFFDTKGL